MPIVIWNPPAADPSASPPPFPSVVPPPGRRTVLAAVPRGFCGARAPAVLPIGRPGSAHATCHLPVCKWRPSRPPGRAVPHNPPGDEQHPGRVALSDEGMRNEMRRTRTRDGPRPRARERRGIGYHGSLREYVYVCICVVDFRWEGGRGERAYVEELGDAAGWRECVCVCARTLTDVDFTIMILSSFASFCRLTWAIL
ncbi:hypothetical protein GWI33_012619 [Rhynchophorus ferrugineus]|uniref:Uncharacterized protein n=1 Tax=Rhynchophorus ferrugineus TaxID=354439 RepID=A0A834M8L6_RHYFE|nr:hypothetical protein GWI33_012619 [Rhynchophorus ferrugineus]